MSQNKLLSFWLLFQDKEITNGPKDVIYYNSDCDPYSDGYGRRGCLQKWQRHMHTEEQSWEPSKRRHPQAQEGALEARSSEAC